MRASIVLVVIASLWSSIAAAQAPRVKDKAKADAARVHFEKGKTAYRLRDYDTAIAEWREGYKTDPDPVYLFNIAQAYREKGVFDEAISFYTSYLREEPQARNSEAVLKRIDEMKAAMEQKRLATEKPPIGPIPPDEEGRPRPTPDEPPRPGGPLRTGGLVVGALGLALVGTGVAFGFMARSDESAVNDALAAGDPWSEALADQESSAKTKALLANVSFAVGGAAIVGGIVLYILGARKKHEAVVLAPAISPRGAGLTLTVAW